MASMSFSLLFLLLLFIFLFSPFPSFSSTQCRPDEHSALLQLRSSFSVVDPSLAHCIREYENGTIYLMMSSWNKNTNCCEWDGVTIGAAAFKALAMNLTNLREFILSDSDMSTVPLVSLMNLSSSLTYLDLGYCQLHGELPQNIFQSHKLQGLDLEGNLLNGTIPSWIFELPYLVDLNIGLNSLTVEASIIGSSKDLEEDVVVEPALAQVGGEGQTSKQRKTVS
ncbi:hypothetical protein TIFTF001_034036 [Ficus carica]|uniref:Leucine-rich repeat-containing N-terminal plant-type domain-containing protein n=1 Tax=Ficus carica TaxID=3494 RepID=A0AA88DZK2_FICCA|nr:hypothetical protein TIFTF001_034036 [Ficus carica]